MHTSNANCLLPVLAALLFLSLALPAYPAEQILTSNPGTFFGGATIGTTPVTYWHDHGKDCDSCGPDHTSGTATAVLAAGINTYGPNVSWWCHGGMSETDIGFNAAATPGPPAGVTINDAWRAGPPPVLRTIYVQAVAPRPPDGNGMAYAKGGFQIGAAPLVGVGVKVQFVRHWYGPEWIKTRLAPRVAAGELRDDQAYYTSVVSMEADGYDPFDVLRIDYRLKADGDGSVAETGDNGITLGGSYAHLSLSVFAMNHEGFGGTATLQNGCFSATGGFADLPWVFSGAPGSVTQAYLPPESVPGGQIELYREDVGDDNFWNSNPRATMSDEAGISVADRGVIPEPASVAALVLGLAGLGGLRLRRRL